MMGTDGAHHRIDLNSSSSSSPRVLNGTGDLSLLPSQPGHKHNTLTTLILSCTVSAGVHISLKLQYISEFETFKLLRYVTID
ncbi:hypothetical protein GBA52_005537 [Prunus armeniaca]|nr:hypothetical protein GBA52_005537 [Prunus armeniaca]